MTATPTKGSQTFVAVFTVLALGATAIWCATCGRGCDKSKTEEDVTPATPTTPAPAITIKPAQVSLEMKALVAGSVNFYIRAAGGDADMDEWEVYFVRADDCYYAALKREAIWAVTNTLDAGEPRIYPFNEAARRATPQLAPPDNYNAETAPSYEQMLSYVATRQ